ncbi:MAG: class I SAM-dependent methyltransferase [Myxococcota bacterium]
MSFWDERYAEDGFAYGLEPNDFLRERAGLLTGDVLCLAEGEGRNATFLASRGLTVYGVDASSVGVAKTLALAAERGVTVHAEQGDLATYDLGEARWDGIVAVFAHLPPPIRRRVHGSVARALRPGGVFLMEVYTPRQLAFGTGGPQSVEMLYEPEAVRAELVGLELEHFAELEREVHEGKYHGGRSAVLQGIARRPVQTR